MLKLPEVEGWPAGARVRVTLYGVAAVALLCAGLALAADSDGDETQTGGSPSAGFAGSGDGGGDAGASRAATGTYTVFQQWDTDSSTHHGLARDQRPPAAGGWGWW